MGSRMWGQALNDGSETVYAGAMWPELQAWLEQQHVTPLQFALGMIATTALLLALLRVRVWLVLLLATVASLVALYWNWFNQYGWPF
jgi:hypothetical protein